MVALNFRDYLIAVTTETKPPVLKKCEEISILCPKEKPQSNRQLYIERIVYGRTQEGNHLQMQDRDQAQILL